MVKKKKDTAPISFIDAAKKLFYIIDTHISGKESDIAGSLEDKYNKLLVPACIELLEARGYRVIPSYKKTYNDIRTMDDLIQFFYDKFVFKYRDKVVPPRNESRDRGTARKFIDAVQKANGLGRKAALIQCAEIIETILDHPDTFKKVFSIGFNILGQGSFVWATERAIEIINNSRNYDLSDDLKEAMERETKRYEGPLGIYNNKEMKDG